MRQVWKFPIPLEDEFIVSMPVGGKVLSAGLDPQGRLCLWALVYDIEAHEERRFCLRGTGHPIRHEGEPVHFVDSVRSGPFMWHVFEVV